MKTHIQTQSYISIAVVVASALLVLTSTAFAHEGEHDVASAHLESSTRIDVQADGDGASAGAETQASAGAESGTSSETEAESEGRANTTVNIDADTPVSAEVRAGNMPVEPDGGIGDGAEPLGLQISQEIAAEKGVSLEVAEIIANAKAEHESVSDINIGDQVSEAAVEIRYNTTRKVLGLFDFETEAVARTSAQGKVKTEYPQIPWFARIFVFGDSEKESVTTLGADIKAALDAEASMN